LLAASAASLPSKDAFGYYPPLSHGLRGQATPGSSRDDSCIGDGKTWPPPRTRRRYDLIASAAGISGLAARILSRTNQADSAS